MIGGPFGKKGSAWPVFGALAVLCALGVPGAVVMQHRALETRVREAEARVGSVSREVIAPLVAGTDLGQPLPVDVAARVSTAVDRLMSSGQIVRVRIHSASGVLVFSSDDADDVGRSIGDPDAIRAAAADVVTSLVAPGRVAAGGGGTTVLSILQVYVQLRAQADANSAAVLQVDQRYRPIEDASHSPWRYVAFGAAAAAVIFLLTVLVGLTRTVLGRRRAARSGFAVPSGRSRTDQAPDATLRSELDRARAELEQQEQRAAEEMERFQQQLRAAVGRAEAAEARVADTEDGDPSSAEQRVAEALARADAAEARATAAEERASAAVKRSDAEAPLDGADPLATTSPEDIRLERELRDAREAAALLQQQMTEAHQEVALAKRDAWDARERAAAAEAHVAQSQALVAAAGEAEAKIGQSTRRATEAERKTQEAEARAARATARADDLATRVTESDRALAEARTRFAELEEVPELRADLEEARLEIKRRQAAADEHQQCAEEAIHRADAADALVREHEAKARAHAARADAIEASAAKQRATEERLEATLADVERRVGDTEERARRFERELAEAREMLASERRREAELVAELEDARSRFKDVDDRIRQADRRAEAAETRLTTSTGGLSAESARLRTELEAEAERGRRAGASAEQAEARASDLEMHASKLAQALEEERILREQADIALTGARVELDHAQTRALEAEGRVEQERRADAAPTGPDIRRLEDAMDELRGRLAEQDIELTSLRTNESAARRELEHARAAARRSDAAWIERTTALEHELKRLNQRPSEAAPTATNDEVGRLRVELEEAVKRATVAENEASRTREELLALAEEVEKGDTQTAVDGDAQPPDLSLRFRLARAANQKRGRLDER